MNLGLECHGAEAIWNAFLWFVPSGLATADLSRIADLNLEPSAYGTHSMRRTKVAQIYTTVNLRAVQLLLGQMKMNSTVRYLRVDIEDALSPSEAIDR